MTSDPTITGDIPNPESQPRLHEAEPQAAEIQLRIRVEPGTRVQVTIEAQAGSNAAQPTVEVVTIPGGNGQPAVVVSPVAAPARKPFRLPRLATLAETAQARLDMTLLWVGLAVYLLVRLIGLTDFPIYFFTDEAIQTVAAADLVHHNFSINNEFLPTYFVNGNQYNLSLSVYLQILPFLLFGKSVLLTRLISVLVTCLGALAICLLLRDIFKVRYWWSGALFLSIAPAWFLHSRTAFETVLAVSFFAIFLYFYGRYRCQSPRHLYGAIIAGALVFYSYSPAQAVIVLCGLFLLISDARYHWENRAIVGRGLILLLVLALPYIRFLITHPNENYKHLVILNSYLVSTKLTLPEKINRFWLEYWQGISPAYWFLPNGEDLNRHLMKGYGHILRPMLPFYLGGLVLAALYWRSPAQRMLFAALLAAPVGAALAETGITRALFLVVPATLFIVLAVSALIEWGRGALERRQIYIPYWLVALILSAVLILTNAGMLTDALVNGPTWYTDYTLNGMQYGARQVFPTAAQFLRDYPGTRLVVTPSWANGTDVIARFFFDDPLPIELGTIDGYMLNRRELPSNTVFVMLPAEFRQAVESGKFKNIRIVQSISYPNGEEGFLFVQLEYSDEFDAILAAEIEARRQPVITQTNLGSEVIDVRHSQLDIGKIEELFDDDRSTFIRTLEANPLVVEVDFAQPKAMQGLTVGIGGTPTRITVQLQVSGQSEAIIFQTEAAETPEPRDVVLDFNQTYQVESMRVEILNVHDGEPAHVHAWDIVPR